MNDFSVTETAFAGYRLLAAKPLTVLWWLAFAIILSLIQIVGTVEMAGPQLAALQDMRAAGQVDPASMAAVSRGMGPYYLFSFVFPWLTGVLTVGAGTRAALFPERSAFGYFRFGGDELRLLITTLVIAVILLLVVMVATIIGVILMAVMGGRDAALALRNGGGLPTRAIIGLAIGATPAVLVAIFLAVKISLAPAATVGERSIQIFSSFSLTKGRFWKALATYALALIPVVVIYAVTIPVMTAGTQGSLVTKMQSMSNSLTSFSGAFSAQHLLGYLLGAIPRVATMAAILVPAGLIYKSAKANAVDVFGDDDDDDD